ncbi:PKD domain-containing protein [Cellulosimicrobium aquatile]|uniref:PKD domain-containing protein n=1 Tax=Cellulosimicrobium aquatile TaxID=1612203 RepID=A0A1N6Q5S1_9MICO|nr:ThuA domain-containing protein [Cellulosimicrobium aquatile]SIQ11912.1 PKD domain-containing protein [Cellulosimicrobium aquatile]
MLSRPSTPPTRGRSRPGALRALTVGLTGVALVAGAAVLPAAAQTGATAPTTAISAGGSLAAGSVAAAPAAAAAPVRVLVFHGAPDEQTDPVVDATAALTEIGAANGFEVEATSDPEMISAATLGEYRGVVMLSAEGIELSGEQEAALQAYINGGGGFLGVRDAARSQEASKWFEGLVGARIKGATMTAEKVAEATGTGRSPAAETPAKAVDGDPNTKWLTFARTGQLTLRMEQPVAVVKYGITSANDSAGRDPKNWKLQGSTDGQTWVDLDTRADEDFPQRFQPRTFDVANETAYGWYRLDVTANSGDAEVQLAELSIYGPDSVEQPDPEIPLEERTVDLVDRQHPATADLPLTWDREDRWLDWADDPTGDVHTVATLEPGADAGPTTNPFQPVSWCRDYDGGRSFFTGMGGTPESWADATFREHLLGALQWTTGVVRGDCQATIASNYKAERLSQVNTAGTLDQNGEQHGLTIAPDGTVFYIGRGACPTGPIVPWSDPNVGLGCGTIHQWDPETGEAKLLTTLDVMGNRGSGDELVKNEEGLLGIVPDPDFATNHWLYVYWMPHENIDRERRVGYRTVSRFTYDPETPTIDQSTRVDLLEWETQIHSCCHAGGGMAFDSEGNLYIGSGDNNSSGGSNGYSGNNWTQEFAGISFQDARRTSGNTNDLNGKILRIHPEDDGTYTIPDDNLFPVGEYPADKTRPEIYVMGVRNISRLQIDPDTDWLTAAWVGPDAGSPSPELGPAKYETATIITSAGNQGWPYCMGNKQPYRDRSNEDASVLTGWYDCDNPKNTSPRNTGLVDLPPVRNNMIWYSPSGGGPVFPDRGNGIPTYEDDEATYTIPWLRGGGQAVMSGPTYRQSQVDPESDVAWPSYWEGKWFIGDQSNSNNRVAVTVDPENLDAPVFMEDLRQIIPGGRGDGLLQSWMDAKFGPDGALYLVDYAGGFFSLDPNQKLMRITYQGGAPTPAPAASATSIQGDPLTVQFTGARSGGVSYLWEFGDGKTSRQANPKHKYPRIGTYEAKLTVTYADGSTATVTTDGSPSCTLPDERETVFFGDVDSTVENLDLGACTMNDLFQDEKEWRTHARFLAHVESVAKSLYDDSRIDERERARLVDAAARSQIGVDPGGYRTIFDGTQESLYDWFQAPSGKFTLEPGGSLKSSGGLGMLWYAGEELGDFSVKLLYRDVSEGDHYANTGVFTRFPNPNDPGDVPCAANQSPAWVAISCGHEIQIYDGPTGEPQKTGSVYNFDPLGLNTGGEKPKGEWNEYEIRVVGQQYTIIRNGVVINEWENTPGQQSSRAGDPPTDLRQFDSGFIGLQNHGNADLIEFRDIRVADL